MAGHRTPKPPPFLMITREVLRGARGVSGAATIFSALGFPIYLRRIDPRAWAATNITAGILDGWELFHASRVGLVELFFLNADPAAARQGCSDFLTAYRKWNTLVAPLIVCSSDSSLAIHGLDRAGRVRRLELRHDAVSADFVERLNLMERRAGEPAWALAGHIERALERESVTRQFFERFRMAVDRVSAELTSQCRESSEVVRDQALLILSRILFLYFLQQKGWLDGDPRFLADRVRGEKCFETLLRPLFFGCLNTPPGQRERTARELGKIPYLNGGLFEPSRFERRHESFTISDTLLLELLDNTFERYSFCIDEGDEEGLHIDPQMLGKVFESLMAEEERLASGSFYTPKRIVDALAEEGIEKWISGCHPERSEGSSARSAQIDPKIPHFARNDTIDDLTRLESVRILDPACGSGAFLLAALHVLERKIRESCSRLGRPVQANLRQKIVERSLFGVDVKPEAVRLCELRLWLSIVSSSPSALEEVEPLPNLDRNILQGNALLGPLDFLAAGVRGDVYRRWSYALQAQQEVFDRYRHASPTERPALCRAIRESDQSVAVALLGSALKADRDELERITTPRQGLFGPMKDPDESLRPVMEKRIAETEKRLAQAQDGRIDFFAFDLHFAHVLAGGGFDIVIGNPPWVRSSRIEPSTRRALAERFDLFGAGRGFDQSDLCLAFWAKSFDIASAGGVVAMLLPSKVTSAGYGSALRRKIMESSELLSVRDWTGSSRELFDADTFPIAMTVRKREPSLKHEVTITTDREQFSIAQGELSAAAPGSAWQLVPGEVLRILRSLQKRFPPLQQCLSRKPLMGVKTGFNERFFIPDVRFQNGSVRVTALDLNVPVHAIVRCVRGRDVARWTIGGAAWMLLPPRPNGGKTPLWVDRVTTALKIDPQEFKLAYVQPEHFGIKVIWKDVSRGVQAAVLPESTNVSGREFAVIPNQTLYMLEAASLQEAHLLAAILNSTIVNALAVAVADRAKDSHFRYYGSTIASVALPEVDINHPMARHLITLSRRAHRGQRVSREIDEAVRRLYRISREDARILGEFVTARLGA